MLGARPAAGHVPLGQPTRRALIPWQDSSPPVRRPGRQQRHPGRAPVEPDLLAARVPEARAVLPPALGPDRLEDVSIPEDARPPLADQVVEDVPLAAAHPPRRD